MRQFIIAYPELILELVSFLMVITTGALALYVKNMKTRIETHINKEENIVWDKFDKRFTSLENRFIDYQEKDVIWNRGIIERLVRVEAKMPNGKLNRIEELLKKLVPGDNS